MSERIAATVAQLLQQSRAEHMLKKEAAGRTNSDGKIIARPDYTKAEAHVREAIRCREEAHALDPEKRDPAWAEDFAQNGTTSDELLAWFRHYLTIP